MRRKINGEAYLIIKKNYTLIIRNSNSDPKITLLIEPTTITSYKFSFFLLRLSKHNFYPDQSSVSQRLLSSQKLLNRTISKSLFPTKTPYQMIIYKPCSLHMSITDRRAKKLKPSFLHIFAHRIRFWGCNRNLLQRFEIIYNRFLFREKTITYNYRNCQIPFESR